jgi:hypothetical protein
MFYLILDTTLIVVTTLLVTKILVHFLNVETVKNQTYAQSNHANKL